MAGDGRLRPGGDVVDPAGVDAELADKAAGAHAGGDGRTVHLQAENAGRHRAGDGRRQSRRDPDAGDCGRCCPSGACSCRCPARQGRPSGSRGSSSPRSRPSARSSPRRPRRRQAPSAPAPRRSLPRRSGSVSAMPMMTETMMPMKNGCSSVAHMMACPTALAAAPMRRRDELGKSDAREDRHNRRDEDVDLCLLADGLAQLGGEDRRRTAPRAGRPRRLASSRRSRRESAKTAPEAGS